MIDERGEYADSFFGECQETGDTDMKQGLFFLGMAMTVTFGGGFLIRLVREGDFYIDQFAGGLVGIVLLIIAMFVKRKEISHLEYRDRRM
jgi:hypothetical protein